MWLIYEVPDIQSTILFSNKNDTSTCETPTATRVKCFLGYHALEDGNIDVQTPNSKMEVVHS